MVVKRETYRPVTSRRQQRSVPPCPLTFASMPLKHSSRDLQFPYRVPFIKEPLPLKKRSKQTWTYQHFVTFGIGTSTRQNGLMHAQIGNKYVNKIYCLRSIQWVKSFKQTACTQHWFNCLRKKLASWTVRSMSVAIISVRLPRLAWHGGYSWETAGPYKTTVLMHSC